MIAEKAIGHGGPSIDYGNEPPKYRQLRTAIQAYYGDLLVPLEELRDQVILLAGLQAAADLPEGAFSITTAQRARINEAVERFLVELAGPVRTREGFVAGGIEADEADGVIQQRNVMTYAVGLQRGARLLDTDTTLTAGRKDPAVTAMLDRAFERLSENGELRLEGVRDELQGILVSATDAGLNPLETARQLSGQFDHYSRVEFERLARTESAYAAIEGTRNQLGEFGVVAVEWLIDVGACEECQLRVGKVYLIDDVSNHPPEHPNCCVAGTVVKGPKALASTERWYVGEVVNLQTVGGHLLTVTPNHPVLTPKGWVAAGLLNEGDEVLCSLGSEGPLTDDPHEYQIPALIEDVARSVRGSGAVPPTRVPTAPMDFHGDGAGSEVCIVRTNRKLGSAVDAFPPEPLLNKLLCWGHAQSLGLPSSGSLALALERIGPPANGSVRRLRHLKSLLRGSAGAVDPLNFAPTAFGDAVLYELPADCQAADAKPLGEVNLCLAGKVTSDHIRSVSRVPFSGHVFNLQTTDEWYAANNIITHNCLCDLSPILAGEGNG